MELEVYHTSGEIRYNCREFVVRDKYGKPFSRCMNDFAVKLCWFYIKKKRNGEYVIVTYSYARVSKVMRGSLLMLVYKEYAQDPFEAVEKFLRNFPNCYKGIELEKDGKILEINLNDSLNKDTREFLNTLDKVIKKGMQQEYRELVEAVKRAKKRGIRSVFKASPERAVEFALSLLSSMDEADVAFMFWDYTPGMLLEYIEPTATIFIKEVEPIGNKFRSWFVKDDKIEPVGDFKRFYNKYLPNFYKYANRFHLY